MVQRKVIVKLLENQTNQIWRSDLNIWLQSEIDKVLLEHPGWQPVNATVVPDKDELENTYVVTLVLEKE